VFGDAFVENKAQERAISTKASPNTLLVKHECSFFFVIFNPNNFNEVALFRRMVSSLTVTQFMQ